MKRKLFGTDGIRGTANQWPMTCEMAVSLGRAVAYHALTGEHRHRIVIGKDTRLSCYMMEMAFASGVCSMGVDVFLVGPMPTPAVAFLTKNMRADAGVMISASHNPYQDNGIKIFARDGFKLPDEIELKLETLMDDDHVESIRPTKSAVGKAYRVEDARGRYLSYVKTVLPESLDFEGLKVVVDCANGAAYQVAPRVLEEMGAEVHAIGVAPNGRNINLECGALYPDQLRDHVLESGADIGVALDGDADRLIVVDNKGDVLDGDCILAIGAQEMLAKGTLKDSTLVSTVMSNMALDKVIDKLGGKVVRTKVGDRYVVEEMRKGGYSFGGENSGHLVYLDHATTGDGLLAALKLIAVMREADAPLSEIRKVLQPFPQSLVNVQVANKTPIEELDSVQKVIEEVELKLAGEGRVMVRYSGTEPKARVLVEGPDAGQAENWAQEIAQELGRALA